MDELPHTKPPREFTGKGFEIIGNPLDFDFEEVSVWFQDGKFTGCQFPSRQLLPTWTAEIGMKYRRAYRHHRAMQLAESIAKGRAGESERAELAAILSECGTIPRQRRTEEAVKAIMDGDFSGRWSFQDRRERAAFSAIRGLCAELTRPPTGVEMVLRMMELRDELDPTQPLLSEDSSPESREIPKNLVAFLRKTGFSWLEFPKRGYRGKR